MYCVKCGIRLDDGVNQCPLCGTAVWNPNGVSSESHYNVSRYPEKNRAGRYLILSLITVLLAASALSCLIACLNVLGEVGWSGYVLFGTLLLYVVCVLPFWFDKYHPMIFVPVGFAAAGVLLLYTSIKTGGRWFLRFGFPVTVLSFLMVYLAIVIARYIKKGRLMLIGLYFILLGGFTMLVEFFEHLAFGTRMFLWSLYPFSVFFLTGLFLFIVSFIPGVRSYLKRLLFI